jgi:hypothetical protein
LFFMTLARSLEVSQINYSLMKKFLGQISGMQMN